VGISCHFAYYRFDYCRFAYDGSPSMMFRLLWRFAYDDGDSDDNDDFIAYLTYPNQTQPTP